jgi:hypothetical protein
MIQNSVLIKLALSTYTYIRRPAEPILPVVTYLCNFVLGIVIGGWLGQTKRLS